MESIFSAQEPSLGYLYQIRYGLLLIVSEKNSDGRLFIEKIDDISIARPNSLDVYQTKMHIKSVANLTNSSTDFWKTIRVWSVHIKKFGIEGCIFNLITTAKASNGSIPYMLKQGNENNRDIDNLHKQFLEVIETSENRQNQLAYEAFLDLEAEKQKELISKIFVVDSSVSIDNIKVGITNELRLATYPNKVEALYERLEGWFFGEVILQLLEEREEITTIEVHAKIRDIADSLKTDNLPVDFPKSIATDEERLLPYRYKTFVKQLEIVGVNSKSINHAISDFYRAFSQKSRWMRDGLISPTDEMQYDDKLIEDWSRKFATLEDCSSFDDEGKKREGKKFYHTYYVSSLPNIHIKERFNEQYMVSGCCHILSDNKKVGWHPEYETNI
jgi:hypothetical protein